jgi:hypothetical protein
MVDQAVSHAANYMEHDGVNKGDGFKAQNMRRWVIGHEYGAPMMHCILSWNANIIGSLQGAG